MKATTLIDHLVRVQMGLSCNEYCICDYFYTANEGNRNALAAHYGIGRQTLMSIINRLIKQGYLMKGEKHGELRCTDQWKKYFENSTESIPETPTFKRWQPSQPLIKQKII